MKKHAVMTDIVPCNYDHPFMIQNNYGNSIFTYCNNRVVLNDFPAFKWLDELCTLYGSSVEGRLTAVKKLLPEVTQRPPLLISEAHGEIYFALNGFRNMDCVWIQAASIQNYSKVSKKKTKLIFCDGTERIFPIDYRVIKREIDLCISFYNSIRIADSFYGI